jgi:tRNA G37 N-methylase Trm5
MNKWTCPLCKREIDISGTSTVIHYREDIIKFHLNLHSRHSKEDLFKALTEAAEKKELPVAVTEKFESFAKTVEIVEAELMKLKIEE